MRTKSFISIPVLFCLLLACQPARATIWTVTSTGDSGTGTLRGAIDSLSGGDTVQFDNSLSGQTILLTSGEIQLDQNVTIDASALSGGITINGNQSSRIFEVYSGVTATLTCLTISNGCSLGGGGIFNSGALTLNRCTLADNSVTNGGFGGGIGSVGSLTLNQCTVAGNSASAGGGIFAGSAGLFGTYGYSPVTLNQCTVSGNSAGTGGAIQSISLSNNSVVFFNSIVAGNSSDSGPDIINTTTGKAPILLGTNLISGNPLLAPLGNYGGPTPTMPPMPGSPAIDAGSDSATGAPYHFTTDQRGLPRLLGAHVDIGAVELQILTVTTNTDSGTGSLRAAIAAASVGADITFVTNLSGQTILLTSGVIYLNLSLNIDASVLPGGIQINGNHASEIFYVNNAIVGLNSLILTNGVAPSNFNFGGAIFNAGTLTLTKCTVTGNSALHGGGIESYNSLTLDQCTVTGNSASVGGGIEQEGGSDSLTLNQSTVAGNSSGLGSGIWIGSAPLYLFNSIVAGNTGSADIENGSSLTLTGTNFIGGNPLLAPLGNYGGPTPTMPPLPGSPVIDAGSDSAKGAPYDFTTDQRGFPRLIGLHVDIGAVEFYTSVVTTNADAGTGSLRYACTYALPGTTTTFDPSLSGRTILLTSGEIDLNTSLNIDASALPGGIQINGNHASRIFNVTNLVTVGLNSLTLTNGVAPSVANFGGSILNQGTLTLTKCTVAGNSATDGGGINSRNQLILNQCTVAGNSATQGGGIESSAGQLALNQSTVAGNSSALVGSGVWVGSSPLYLFNSIVAGNTGSADLFNAGALSLMGTNLIGGNPMLAPLGNYGGPTQTMPPLPGSPVIDAGSGSATNSPYGFTTDQRGLPRLIGPGVDIGAVEFYASVVTTNADSGPGSLRYVCPYAAPNIPITFAANLSGQTITLTSGEIALSNTLSIDASALPSGITLSGNHASRIFDLVSSSASINLNALTITQGSTPDAGGAIYSSPGSYLHISRCTLTGSSGLEGGAILNDGTLLMENSTLTGNNGTYGGALQCRYFTTLNQCTITGNSAGNGGGGVFNKYETLTNNNCIIAGNTPVMAGCDLYSQLAALVYVNTNLVQSILEDRPSAADIGPAPLTGNPLLAPLGNYGGPTQTMPPLGGSAALDAGGPTALTIDQRGFPRVSGLAPDLGAVEAQVASQRPVLTGASRPGNGPMQFQFTNLTGGSFTVYASTNLAAPFNTWTNLGPAIEFTPGSGQFQFTDPQATNNPRCFYRVHSP